MLRIQFFDNTDPDGMDRVLATIGSELGQTLCLVVSKSGGIKEARNGMLEAEAAFKSSGMGFAQHAVVITRKQSELDRYISRNGWIEIFPMWDWVGERTSELSAVGLLPAALQWIRIDKLLAGARACDEITRVPFLAKTPQALLALAWFQAGNGKGDKNMVFIPYEDRWELFAGYLQQLIMESLGKERDIEGVVVNQGLPVFGNKGATDQYSYIQQLRYGLNEFIVTFIEVLVERDCVPLFVELNITSGDYLHGFLGTREALAENVRESVTISIREASAANVGIPIAMFERAVGYYASLVNVNAYNQPGVEAGKKAASAVLETKLCVLDCLSKNLAPPMTVQEIVSCINAQEAVEHVVKICEHLSDNPAHRIVKLTSDDTFESKYS